MWGWKTVDRLVEPSVSFDEAKTIVQSYGFEVATSNPKHCVFKRRGTDNGWTSPAPEGARLPLDLALAEADRGLFVQLRYDHFVLFDTGDLRDVADEIAKALGAR